MDVRIAPSGWTSGRMRPSRKAKTAIATYAAVTATMARSMRGTPTRRPRAGARHASSAMIRKSIVRPDSCSGSPRRTVEIALACTSPPAITSSLLVGTGWTSCSFGEAAPTTTVRPAEGARRHLPVHDARERVRGDGAGRARVVDPGVAAAERAAVDLPARRQLRRHHREALETADGVGNPPLDAALVLVEQRVARARSDLLQQLLAAEHE